MVSDNLDDEIGYNQYKNKFAFLKSDEKNGIRCLLFLREIIGITLL